MNNKLLTPAEKDFLITELANANKIEPSVLRAIVDIESSGTGFYDEKSAFNGKCKVRFEPDYFEKFASSRPYFLPASITTIAAKAQSKFTGRLAYEQAILQSPAAAIKATSFGLGQIMGFNHERVGYKSLLEFSQHMEESEYRQLTAFVKFLTSNKQLLQAVQMKDFKTIALLYNGKNYASRQYDQKLELAYKALTRRKTNALTPIFYS